MKIADIQSNTFFPSRIEGALGYYVTRLQFARDGQPATLNAVFYYRGSPDAHEWDNSERVITPGDFCEVARLPDEPSHLDADRAPLLEVIRRVKLRLHFVQWPGEAMWNAGTEERPVWIPDWRFEIALIENALHGTPITAAEKPTDTIKRNAIPAQSAELPERVLEAMFDNEADRGAFAAQFAKALRLAAEVQS